MKQVVLPVSGCRLRWMRFGDDGVLVRLVSSRTRRETPTGTMVGSHSSDELCWKAARHWPGTTMPCENAWFCVFAERVPGGTAVVAEFSNEAGEKLPGRITYVGSLFWAAEVSGMYPYIRVTVGEMSRTADLRPSASRTAAKGGSSSNTSTGAFCRSRSCRRTRLRTPKRSGSGTYRAVAQKVERHFICDAAS